MTKEQKLDMFSMHLDGITYEEIGKKYDISKQAVYQIIHPVERARKIQAEQWAYPNVAAWAKERGLSAASISRMTGLSQVTVLRLLKGTTKRTLQVVNKMLDLTGMTYEEFFYQPKQ